MTDTADRVRAIVADVLDIEPAAVTDAAELATDLQADSLDLVELVMELERHFNVEIDDAELETLKTVGDVVTLLTKRAA